MAIITLQCFFDWNSIRLTARLLVKQLKDAENREQKKIKLLYLLFTDGNKEILAQAYSAEAIYFNESLEVRSSFVKVTIVPIKMLTVWYLFHRLGKYI